MTARPRRWTRRAALALVATGTLVAATMPAQPAGAAGVTTHSWMAVSAIDEVTSPQLKALLNANVDYVRAGAHFPDSGYALTNTYGEEAHWQRLHDAYAKRILAKPECTNLAAPNGPCAKMVAFLMGMIGHGMGDEVWDWLLEPYVADFEEYYTPASMGGYANEGGAESQLDIAAIGIYGASTAPLPNWPSPTDLLAAFQAAGFTDVDAADLSLGQVAMNVVQQAERAWVPDHLGPVKQTMPWTSHNMATAPGGVDFAATAIAGAWDSMWGQLTGAQPQTKVSITYPANGELRVPASGWERNHLPGSARGRGGARQRITAVLTYARPYTGSQGTVSSELPAGSMTLVERDTAAPVAIEAGWPRSIPYGPDAGEHLVGIQPAADLQPCTWYRVGITPNLVDARNEPVAAMTSDFRTGTAGSAAGEKGGRCPDDPFTADERFARAVRADLLDAESSDADLRAVTQRLERGTTRRAYVSGVLASDAIREEIVVDGFAHYLDRVVDPSGRTYWATKLKAITIPEFHARLLASEEVYRNAGGTNSGYVAALYPLVHGRNVDPSGLAYWTRKLDQGLGRRDLAKSLLTSRESADRTVKQAYQDLLGRAPDAGGLKHWTDYLMRGKDPRALWESLILSNEYNTRAQAS